MSHFTVLVVADDIDSALQPFHEFECTGTNDQYVTDEDVTEECRTEGLAYHGLEDKTVTDEAAIDKDGAHKYGYAVVDAAGNIVRAVNRTNKNKRWDWWVLGGRWSGFLKLKLGAQGETGAHGVMDANLAVGDDRADQARKGDIDFEGMRAQAGAEAGALWDRVQTITGGQRWDDWNTVRERHAGDIDAARTAYHEQAAVLALAAADRDTFGWALDDTLAGPREAFVQVARDKACPTFAIVHNGEWSEKQWERLFSDFIDALPDDALLSVVDCHI